MKGDKMDILAFSNRSRSMITITTHSLLIASFPRFEVCSIGRSRLRPNTW